MKIAVITGASSGIGRVTAKQLLTMGWKVYGLSRSTPKISHNNFVWLKSDLAKSSQVAASLEHVTEPGVDLVVSNAGVAFEEPASAVTKHTYEKMFEVNVLAPMLLVNALRDRVSHATIISVSSVSDRLVEKDFALYCSSKAANTRYFEALAKELTEAKVVSLLPDYVDTPMLRQLQAGRDFDWQATIKVENVATLIVDIVNDTIHVSSGSNVIIVTDNLVEDLSSREKLYGFNTDTGKLTEL